MRFPLTPESAGTFCGRSKLNHNNSLKRIAGALVVSASVLFPPVLSATTINSMGGGDGSELNLQQVFDSLTVGGSSSINVDTDQLSQDALWSLTATGGSVSTLAIEISSYAPRTAFGIYDPDNPDIRVELFNGAATQSDQTVLSIEADGSVLVDFEDTGVDLADNLFGYYIDRSRGRSEGLFFSDTSLNEDSFDHLVAYQGTNTDTLQIPGLAPGLWTDDEYALAWEDMNGGGDHDYQDFVVLVESVSPGGGTVVPVPAAVWLMCSGLIALLGPSAFKRKRAG